MCLVPGGTGFRTDVFWFNQDLLNFSYNIMFLSLDLGDAHKEWKVKFIYMPWTVSYLPMYTSQ